MRKVIFCGAVNRPPGGGLRSENGVVAYGTDVVYVIYVTDIDVTDITDGEDALTLKLLLNFAKTGEMRGGRLIF